MLSAPIMGELGRLTLMPVSVLVVFLILPLAAMEYIWTGVSLLATVGAFLRCHDKATALKLITGHTTGSSSLLKTKFPNSIAVRS